MKNKEATIFALQSQLPENHIDWYKLYSYPIDFLSSEISDKALGVLDHDDASWGISLYTQMFQIDISVNNQ